MSDCIFCKIINGEIPSKKVYESDQVLAFHDITPQAPVHLLIIPKNHIPSALQIDEGAAQEIMPEIFSVITKLAKEFNLEESGFRIVNNCGREGGQTVDHLHFHLLGGRQLMWPPG